MCEFISWVQQGEKVFFLTYDQIYTTPRGDALRKWDNNSEDYIGHGAIRFYYELEREEGTNKERTDFSTPKNFPPVIVKAIKEGKFRGLGQQPLGLLCATAYAEYKRIRDPALAEYQRICATALAEYQRIRDPAEAEYQRIRDPAEAENQRICATAYAEYKRIRDPALAEYQRICATAFWDLFAIPANRATTWR